MENYSDFSGKFQNLCYLIIAKEDFQQRVNSFFRHSNREIFNYKGQLLERRRRLEDTRKNYKDPQLNTPNIVNRIERLILLVQCIM